MAGALAGVILILFGLMLRIGKMVEMLAGYKEEDVEDKEGLANWSGNMLLIMGVLSLGAMVFEYLIADRKMAVGISVLYLMVVAIFGSLIMIVGCEKFKKKKK